MLTAPSARGVVGELVQQRDDRLLAGVGDVEAGKARALGGEQQVGQRLGAEAQRLQVDQLVDVAQALLGALLLVHRRGARGLDAGADQADHEGGAREVDRVALHARLYLIGGRGRRASPGSITKV